MKTRSSLKVRQKPKKEKEINKQLIIRFPQDIADRIHEKNYNAKLIVEFQDNNNAKCQIFDEHFEAVLVSLPTIVETFRTSDGFHLFKSGEISDILIVYRQNERPPGVTSDYKYDHGITPPTTDIVIKRKTKQEAIAITHHESFLNDVEYWDLAELHITALTTKEKKTQKKEIIEEPDIDPVILEKVLRKNGYYEYIGYSGTEISQDEVDEFDMTKLDYYLSHPSSYKDQQFYSNASANTNESSSQSDFLNDFENIETSDSNASYFQEDKSSQDRSIDNSDTINASEDSPNSDISENETVTTTKEKHNFFEDEDTEEDLQDDIIRQLEEKKTTLLTERENCRIRIHTSSSNDLILQKIRDRISTIDENIKEIDEKIREMNNH